MLLQAAGGAGYSRIVHQYVDGTKLSQGRLDHLLYLLAPGQVYLYGKDPLSSRIHLDGRGSCAGRIDISQDNPLSTGFKESLSAGPANAAGRSGDNCDSVFKGHVLFSNLALTIPRRSSLSCK